MATSTALTLVAFKNLLVSLFIVSVNLLHILCASIAVPFLPACVPMIAVEADFTSILYNALVFLNSSTAILFHKLTLST